MRPIRRLATPLLMLALLFPAERARASGVDVFAAASLTEAFAGIAKLAERRHPGLHVEIQFAGSQQLAMQIEQGAPADVFASADEHWMTYLRDRGLLAGEPRDFAHNRLVVIVPESDPGHVARLADLARPGVKVVLGAAAVPVGRYAREALEKISRSPGFAPDFRRRVLRNVVSEEESVTGVVAKVELGEADAGIVYGSDVTHRVAAAVRVLDIPERANVIATYAIAVLTNAPQAQAARDFLDAVLSPSGQAILRGHRLVPIAAPRPR